MSTAKDILDRCNYLLTVAKEIDSRRVYIITKDLKQLITSLEEYRNTTIEWNQETVDNIKEGIEELAISLENVLASENYEIQCIVKKRRYYKQLLSQVNDILPQIKSSKDKDIWLLMFGYATKLEKRSKRLLIDEDLNMKDIVIILKDYVDSMLFKRR